MVVRSAWPAAGADGAAESLLSPEFISWTGGGLTMVIWVAEASERWFFISRCSWQRAHQCRQQCTMHGSHGESYKITIGKLIRERDFYSLETNTRHGFEPGKMKIHSIFLGQFKRRIRKSVFNFCNFQICLALSFCFSVISFFHCFFLQFFQACRYKNVQ